MDSVYSDPEKYNKLNENNKKYYHQGKSKEYLKQLSKERREHGKLKEWQRKNTTKLKEYANKRQIKNHKITKEEWEKCKLYFDNKCAYCGLQIEHHLRKYKDKIKQGDFHKEHVFPDGENDLSNCVPCCKSCNSEKHTKTFEEWFTPDNPKFNNERYNKIIKWLKEDYKESELQQSIE